MCNSTNQRCIVPPHLLEYIAKHCDEKDKEYVLRTLEHVNSLMSKSAQKPPLQKKDITKTDKEKSN
ncbi:protealysin propeptide domain-containing protein [Xenorhabdus innexi]|uniref:Peptidase M4 n=1 Tax=Xenorhabdus innexi TaxID=290109 RepID=A0A1N6MVF7_9GAMM|nr:protealysin propeptide domain-containing protein [Xenorhabdus innexi]PHM38295.1 peptidase M4 [Xenorhabdus innexi]SIP72836.1 conserved hypothetical protein [Xenorhabdus innexi]